MPVDSDDSRARHLRVLRGKVAEAADAENSYQVRGACPGGLHGLVGGDPGARQRRGVEGVDRTGHTPDEGGLGRSVLGEAAVDDEAGVPGPGA